MFTESAVSYVGEYSPESGLPEGRETVPHRYSLEMCALNSPRRPELESFIKDSFRRTYGADVHLFMPTLLVLSNEAGAVCAVAGYRSAFNHLLYLEDYLDNPVEMALGDVAGHAITRRATVEIGNFCARDRQSARELMRRLPAYLVETGRLWSVFTATKALRRMLRDLGAQPLELCKARPDRIIGGARRWGSYYDADPRVMAGYLPAALELEAFRPID